MKTIILFFFFIVISQALSAQISGVILDEHQQRIPGANIYIEGSYDGSSSDDQGKFEFTTSLKGKITLIVSFIGYEAFKQEINLNDSKTELRIQLKPSDNNLETIEITAGSFAAGDKYKSIALKPFDIATTASAEGDIYGAMTTLPGAQKVGEEGMLFVRGGESYETKTYMDGILVQNPYYSKMPDMPTRGRFSPLLFNGTVFSTGGYSAEFGQALSSVLLLNTSALAPKTQASFMLLTVGGAASYTKRLENSSLSINTEYQNLMPYFSLAKQRVDWVDFPENLGGTVVYRKKTSETGMIKSFISLNQNKSGLLYTDLDNDEKDTIKLVNHDYYVNTTYSQMLSEDWMLKTGIAFNYSTESMGINKDEFDERIQGVETRLAFENSFSEKFKLTYGGTFTSSGYREKIGLLSLSTKLENSFNNNIYAGFAEAQIQLSNKFAARTGLRTEYIELEERVYLSPRISVAYKLGEFNQLSAAYGIFSQTPDKDYLKINQNLYSEQATHYIINYQYQKSNRVLRMEAYYKDYQHLIKFSNAYSYVPEDYKSSGKGYSTGFDFFWRDNKTIKNGEYWISYSLNDTKRDYRDYPASSTPTFASKHNFSMVYKQFLPNISSLFGLTYSYLSGRPYYNPNNLEFHSDYTTDYHNLSGNFTYIIRYGKTTKMIHFTVNNILGIDNVFSYRYSTIPDENGIFKSIPVKQPSKRFFVLGFILMLE